MDHFIDTQDNTFRRLHQENALTDINRSMLYPGTAGIINQKIADAQAASIISETNSNIADTHIYYPPTRTHLNDLESKILHDIPIECNLNCKEKQEIIEEDLFNETKLEDDVQLNDVAVVADSVHSVVYIATHNRRVYPREKLLLMRSSPLSQVKPKELLDSCIINELIGVEQNHLQDYRCWRWNTMANTNVPRHIDLGITEPILQHSEDSYKSMKEKLATGVEIESGEELIRQIKGILNRIVPQNFDQCLLELLSLKINTCEGLTCLVNELFLKAVKEDTYGIVFAQLCSKLSTIAVGTVVFKEILLQKCQALLSTSLKEQMKSVRDAWCRNASFEDPNKRGLMENDIEEQMMKAKDIYCGNIRFIGELYVIDVVTADVICMCIDYLMTNDNDRQSIICLCQLLETCGAKFELDPIGNKKIDRLWETLRYYIEANLVDTRVRFRIQDLFEMRAHNWSQRKGALKQKH